MYTIRNGVVYDNGEDTGVKAYYDKCDVFDAYGWDRETGRRRLNAISHKIYDRKPDGTYNRKKKRFSPAEMCRIWDYYGLA